MILVLSVQSGPDKGAGYPISEEMVIGRSMRADVVLRDEAVSREHARVRPEGMTVIIEDLGSANGTFVNGDRVDEAIRLEAGDTILAGDTELVVSVESGEYGEQASTPSEPTVIRPAPESGTTRT